ncbi:peroxisomal membrane anchor protein conserved region-domain-containing protein [Boeremia exigua]|uniref:peroxisomal membrane anchor protein conserved region-domain-containing protein n=1 Tax=Boeremia exigua TaxID=749465 RepID=UPI001E8C9D39|nr:peroxisomal membrane anchor protein conserved region-domain-containing protein [Boeremia exigua]KAH6618800.1 peroxisomal membrane anchor protein conserved region-domain-containing protein [Boeremia exigua]
MSKPSIPAWQRTATTDPPTLSTEEQPKPENAAEDSTKPVAEEPGSQDITEKVHQSTDLLAQASRFLEDPNIRNAPREKKAVFLQAKGVSAEDIETLLGNPVQEDAFSDLEEVGARAWSTTSPQAVERSFAPPPQPREIPPIVTYPEFLAQTEKPPPLVTTKRLVDTAYIAGGLMATMYGLSKYIIAPMAYNLAEARHDFAAHTQEQLVEFNKKLGGAVSVDPASKVKKTTSEIGDDVSEADSDPTELYHRDYGTQTTPNLSRRPSLEVADAHPMVTAQENRLKIIKSHLNELVTNRSNSVVSRDSLHTKVSDLTTYLNDMSYQNQYYSSMNGMYGSNYGLPSGKDGKTDQIDVLKQDIRAVKGVFLSARNFPTGGQRLPGTRTPPSAMPTGRRTPPTPTGR